MNNYIYDNSVWQGMSGSGIRHDDVYHTEVVSNAQDYYPVDEFFTHELLYDQRVLHNWLEEGF